MVSEGTWDSFLHFKCYKHIKMSLYCPHLEAMVIKNMKDDQKRDILVYMKQCSLLHVSTNI